jgi:hypothetical protein
VLDAAVAAALHCSPPSMEMLFFRRPSQIHEIEDELE